MEGCKGPRERVQGPKGPREAKEPREKGPRAKGKGALKGVKGGACAFLYVKMYFCFVFHGNIDFSNLRRNLHPSESEGCRFSPQID